MADAQDTGPRPAVVRLGAFDVVRLGVILWVAWYHFDFLAVMPYRFGSEEAFKAWGIEHLGFFRAMFFSGRFTLQAFLFLSAFALTYSAVLRGTPPWGRFFASRARRIYPSMVVSAAFLVAFFYLRSAIDGQPLERYFRIGWLELLWNVLGGTFFSFVRPLAVAWWFIGLILSFYLLFPLLFGAMRRFGVPLFVAGSAVATVAVDLFSPDWLRAAFVSYPRDFVGCRFFEISLGMALADHLARGGEEAWRRFVSPGRTAVLVPLAIALLILPGWELENVKGPLRRSGTTLLAEGVRGFALFWALAGLAQRLPSGAVRAASFLAGPSLVVYLVHMPMIDAVAPYARTGARVWSPVVFALFMTAVFAFSWPLWRLAEWIGRAGRAGRAGRRA